MDYWAHLPLIAFDERPWTLQRLLECAKTAEQLGFQGLAANDHLLFPRPWLDGPTALAAVLSVTHRATLATTVALPVLRGPTTTAKGLAAIDLLSGGRLIVGVGAGSSLRDYAAVGIPFEERWRRLDEAIQALRALWRRESLGFKGKFYSTQDVVLEPYPAQQSGPPIWIGSWGSEAGLLRTARLGDGWMASAYNTTPEAFASAWQRLRTHVKEANKDPDHFPNAISTMFFYVTEERAIAEQIVRENLAPALNRSEDELRQRLLVGSADECAAKLRAYQSCGVQRISL
ncbi:MAG: TIGR03619 family F420-dependent LLM class oxidoreductase [Chloroflexi bacterium]|nr:TIGR03619 family F420-dependent LLM class oxidoreductase [Chloroflexota bacterium]